MQTEHKYIQVGATTESDATFVCKTKGNCLDPDCLTHWNGVLLEASYPHYASGGTADPINWPGYFREVRYRQRPASTERKNWNNYQSYFCKAAKSPNSKMKICMNADSSSFTHVYEMDSAFPYAGFVDTQGAYPFGVPGAPINGGLPAMYSLDPGTDLIPPPDNLDQLITMSLKSMLPGIKRELSLLNSIFELKDFKGTIKTLRALRSGKLSSITKILPKSMSLRNVLRSISKTHLTFAFAIIPLIQDIAGLYRAFVNTNKKVNDILTRENTIVTRHWTWWLHESASSDTSSTTYTPMSCRASGLSVVPVTQERISRQLSSKFHAEIQYSFTLSEYQRRNAQALGFQDAIGLGYNQTPSIIWNAIPWTFAVDWLINISEFLDRWTPKALGPAVNIHRYLWSVSRARITELRVNNTSPVWCKAAKPGHNLVVNIERSYRRTVTMPSRSLLLQVSGLSPKELLLGASLVFARRKHR